MKLKIGKLIDPIYTDTFVCEIETMLGDGDAYHTVITRIESDNVNELEKLLKAINKESWGDNFEKLTGFSDFFGDDQPDYNEDAEWRYDCDCGTYYCYCRHEYFWYDSEGRKYKATLRKGA